MTVRKNFVFDESVAEHLAELAKENGKSMTAMVQEIIEDRYRSSRVKKRLEAFENSIAIADREFKGMLKERSIQSVKADMDV
jgi:macrodomain Ter protein organizer (MatP/YcbG family)